MDLHYGWFQPEQQGPALQLWKRIMDGLPENHDYIALTTGSAASTLENKYPASYPGTSKQPPQPGTGAGTSTGAGTPGGAPGGGVPCFVPPCSIIGAKGGTPWMKANKKLHEEIEDFFEYIKPTEVEEGVRWHVVKRIEKVVRQMWPQAECAVFGSFYTGIYMPTSDVDLVISGEWETSPLYTMQNALLEAGIADAGGVKVLSSATVPLVKLTDKSTDIKVDISFNQKNSVKTGELIKSFCQEFPHLPKLVFVLKQYLQMRGLNEVFTGGLSSYSVILLVVSFFQLHVRPNEVRSNDGSVNLGVLLLEFLEMYGRFFNFEKVGIRIKDKGCLLPRQVLTDQLVRDGGKGITNEGLCIEDPLTPGNNIGRRSFGTSNVQKSFDFAFMTLEQAVHPSFLGIIEPNHSILGRIIRISDEVMEYRTWLRENFSHLVQGAPLRGNNALGHHHSRHHYHGNNINNNNNNHRYLGGRMLSANNSETRNKRSLSVYPSSGNGESCSSSLSSVGSDKGSWQDEEDPRDRDSEERDDEQEEDCCDSRSDLDSSSDFDEGGHPVNGAVQHNHAHPNSHHRRHQHHHHSQQQPNVHPKINNVSNGVLPLHQQQQQSHQHNQQHPSHHGLHGHNPHHNNGGNNRDQQQGVAQQQVVIPPPMLPHSALNGPAGGLVVVMGVGAPPLPPPQNHIQGGQGSQGSGRRKRPTGTSSGGRLRR
ncbi:non-canonical poly(A) RNA polymerase PAPD5-like isoform X2 [Varroa jacobsoni]|uniref:non-canonical poly(A) RNA polymerase PAPD5-like isoform X2 n=1 Tax=Varroa jacobsoni TaxID=62625 RepID=UPI000BF679C0|nr:non-canonical poly(A) RNA polymerase PAPD5-like isoform X2 [Varroa jacobsoni]